MEAYDRSVKELNVQLSELELAVERAVEKTWKALDTLDSDLALNISRYSFT